MKSSPKLIFLLTLLASIAGFFLRQRQLETEILPGGLLAQGSFLHIVLLIVSLLLLVSLVILLLPLEKRKVWDQVYSPWTLPNGLLLLSSIGLLAANLLALVQGTGTKIAAVAAPKVVLVLLRLQAPLGLVCALCIAAWAFLCLYKRKPSPLLYMIASIYFIVRLIVHFQSWNTDPSIHDYAFRLMAAICAMLAVFQLAGFSFDKGKRRMSLFWCLSALFFCAISLADGITSGDWTEILANISFFVFFIGASLPLLFCKGAKPFVEIPKETEEHVPPAEAEEKSDEKT